MKHNSFIKRYAVGGLQYYHDFEIDFRHPYCILVGENGVGKTTILNILYAVLSKKWAFLSSCAFDFIEIEFKTNQKIFFSHAELDAYIFETYTENKENLEVTINISRYFSSIEQIINDALPSHILYLSSIRNIKDDLKILHRELTSTTITPGQNIDKKFQADLASIEKDILIPLEVKYLGSNLLPNDNLTHKYINCCNSYLVNTRLIFDKVNRTINLYSKIDPFEQVQSSQLSSGEKQIIYIFSEIYQNQNTDLCILIDEPEMNLSLVWQRKILPDLLDSGKCDFLLAITHSPFIFDNELDKYAEGINIYFK